MLQMNITAIFVEIITNKIFVVTLLVWIVAQSIKIVINLLRGKKFNFKWVLSTGGMPSSHAAGVAALATGCGLQEGFQSGLFALAAVFAMVTMFDAQGVRRSTGVQAAILNKVVDDLYLHKKVEIDRVREFVGHTPIQVLAGFLLGSGLTILFF